MLDVKHCDLVRLIGLSRGVFVALCSRRRSTSSMNGANEVATSPLPACG